MLRLEASIPRLVGLQKKVCPSHEHRKRCLVIGREVIAIAAIYRCGDTAPRVGESVHRVGESVHRAGYKCPIN